MQEESPVGTAAVVELDATAVRRANEERTQVLLVKYHSTKEPSALAEIVELNLDYVKGIVAQVTNTVPWLVDFDDLVSYGVMGLMSAINLYRPEADEIGKRKTRFSTYAFPRIRGSVQDAIRRMSSTSRTRNVHYVPLEDRHTHNIVDPAWDEFSKGLLPPGVTKALREAVHELPLRQGIIILLSIHGMQLSGIEKILGISYTRVIQERQNAIQALRLNLEDRIGNQRETWEE